MTLSSENGPSKIFYITSVFLVDVEVLSAVLVEVFTIQTEKLFLLRHQLRFQHPVLATLNPTYCG